MKKTYDITDLLFPIKKLSPEEESISVKKSKLWSDAETMAIKNQEKKAFSPMGILEETKRIYVTYLQENKLKYNERDEF